jgi:hypothetical protein
MGLVIPAVSSRARLVETALYAKTNNRDRGVVAAV